MRFKNLSGAQLQFRAGGKIYTVAPDDECEIPERHAYVVALRGIKLTPIDEEKPAAKPEVPKDTPKAPARTSAPRVPSKPTPRPEEKPAAKPEDDDDELD